MHYNVVAMRNKLNYGYVLPNVLTVTFKFSRQKQEVNSYA
jgi:hypothetical protein